ncbi:MAG: GNAT family protein [Pseudomonadota bacterium]
MLPKIGQSVRLSIPTRRLMLRPPHMSDFTSWAKIRREGRAFLEDWEPVWAPDHFTRASFRNRVAWAQRAIREQKALPLFLTPRGDDSVIGAITLDNIRRGPAQAGSVGYWIGPQHAQQGLMTEALQAVVAYSFQTLDLSRIEAACLPENKASRALLERAGFKYEGVAQSYLQINGRWRTHVLYANLRPDRRGKTSVG